MHFRLNNFDKFSVKHERTDFSFEKNSKMDSPETLPPPEFLYEDASHCRPSDNDMACSAVIPSLPLTIRWLRDCVKQNPSLRLQVLNTI